MIALVTGGAGFIGSHLCEYLLKKNYIVYAIDDLSTGNLNNIKHLIPNYSFHFYNASILNEHLMYMLVEKCNVIYHMAAVVGVNLVVNEPVRTITTNIKGTENVLSIANIFKRKIFIASTSDIYGKNEKVPFTENSDCVFSSTSYNRWSYSYSKAIDEYLALAYFKNFGLPVVIARIFNTIGPKQTGKYGMVVPRFIHAALYSKPIIIYGTGEQQRCFAYINDVIKAIVNLMECKEACGKVFNIGTTNSISINDLADKIKKITNSQSQILHRNYKDAYGSDFEDIQNRIPSIDKIKDFIDYNPEMDIDIILSRIINA